MKTEDVIAAIQKYFLPLFDPATSVAVVVATPSQVDHIEEGLTKAGLGVEKQTMKVDREGEEMDECGSSGNGSGNENANGNGRVAVGFEQRLVLEWSRWLKLKETDWTRWQRQ